MSANSSSAALDLRCMVRERMISFLQKHDPQSLPTLRDAVTLSSKPSVEQVPQS